MKELISIVVPVYNVEYFLPKCLLSLVEQTYKRIEILVVDDGSTDSSASICDEYQDKYPDLIHVIHTENHGLSAARNVGLSNAQGAYVGFVDSDDWVEPEMFEVLHTNLKKYDADISSCGLKYDYNEEKNALVKQFPVVKCTRQEFLHAVMTNPQVYGYVWNKLFKTSVLQKLQFDESLRSCEDLDFTVKYAARCDVGVYTQSELYHYRQRLGSMTGEFEYNPRKMSILAAYEKIMPIYMKEDRNSYYILERNYLKININILGRTINSGCGDKQLEKRLRDNIDRYYTRVMQEKRNSRILRLNVFLSKVFPGMLLKCKQLIMRRKYR